MRLQDDTTIPNSPLTFSDENYTPYSYCLKENKKTNQAHRVRPDDTTIPNSPLTRSDENYTPYSYCLNQS